jgi:hypothetical protein
MGDPLYVLKVGDEEVEIPSHVLNETFCLGDEPVMMNYINGPLQRAAEREQLAYDGGANVMMDGVL